MIRLQKYMSECGIASRRKSEELIKKGEVSVNGVIVTELGTKVNGNEEIIVSGKILRKEDKEYYLLYKPKGVISSAIDDKNRTTVIDLIESKKKLFPVGRLDYNTTGVLLITNDGELTNKLTHPKFEVEKVYEVKLEGIIKIDEVKILESGIMLDGIKTKRCEVKLKKQDKRNNKSYLIIKITEGRNHEVKNMFKYFGYDVIKLKRIRYSFLDLGGLKEGEYRPLNIKEIKKLYSLTK